MSGPARKKDRFNRFAWRDAVFADPETSANAKCLAFAIAKHVSGETGEAFPSTMTLAEECGMSEKWVRNTIPELQSTGWMEFQRGSRGRGDKHCNRYRINRKKRPQCPVLKPSAVSGFSGPEKGTVKPDFSTSKADTVSEEPLNHKKERSFAARSSRVDRDSASNSTADDAAFPEPDIPVQRARDRALTQSADQDQPPPSRPSPDLGRPAANGRAAPATSPFAQVLSVYPEDRVGDAAKAYFAFCRALDARGDLDAVLEGITSLMLERGADLPDLADALAAIIERNLAITTNEPAQEDGQ